MKKFLLSLLCIGGILALPGCCCRKVCEEPCEEYCEDYCEEDNYCQEDDYCDKPCNNGKELMGYEEQQGYRKNNMYSRTQRVRSSEVEVARPKKSIYHTPIHPGIIEKAEAEGKGSRIEYLDPRYGNQNKDMAARAEAPVVVPQKRNSRKTMQADLSDDDMK